MSHDLVALMPMRHTSERVPGKNYRPCAGKPLFHHALEALLAVDAIDVVVIDTDSPVILEGCAESFPEVICIDRPPHLVDGATPMTEVLQHDATLVDSAWYLQTHSTNPLLTASTIDRAIERLRASPEADSLFSVTRLQTRLYDGAGAPINHDPRRLLRTQDLPPVYEENSNLYLFSRNLVRQGRRIGDAPLMFETPALESVDIDTEDDFLLAESLLAHRRHR